MRLFATVSGNSMTTDNQNTMDKEKPKRQAISKTVRFEVFKRDKFKCQYCGASAP